jgi:hypothetical protein
MSKHNSGSYYINLAKKNNLRVEPGRGDHFKVFASVDRGYMTIPAHRELANGTECAIRKFFKTLGIVLAVVLIGALLLAVL